MGVFIQGMETRLGESLKNHFRVNFSKKSNSWTLTPIVNSGNYSSGLGN